MKIGITGWKGFIGSHLARRIDSPVLFQGDMRNLEDVKHFVGQCDRIYHLAGKNRAEGDGEILANNLVATGNMVLATKLLCKNVEIVFASSKQVEWNPNSEYGMCKAVEESIIREARKWCIFRIPNVYGEGCRPFYNSVAATFCWQIAHGEPCTIRYPLMTREFAYIGDLVEKLATALDEPSLLHHVLPLRGEIMSIGAVHEYLTTRLGEHGRLRKCLDWYKRQEQEHHEWLG
jgi:UDP-2-acetamido-2,6-beta-L-arabino-hexul-4-ose reductase